MTQQVCTHWGTIKPATREFFGSTPSGRLRRMCRECGKKRSREYEEKNKQGRRKRDAKRASGGDGARTAFDDRTKRNLLRRQHGLCPCCGEAISTIAVAEVDHATPLSRGGKHDDSNFMLAHRQCNKEKHNKTLKEHWEWRVTVGLDSENLGRRLGLIR